MIFVTSGLNTDGVSLPVRLKRLCINGHTERNTAQHRIAHLPEESCGFDEVHHPLPAVWLQQSCQLLVVERPGQAEQRRAVGELAQLTWHQRTQLSQGPGGTAALLSGLHRKPRCLQQIQK